MAATFPIAPFTTPTVMEPLVVVAPWSKLALTLDIVALAGAMRVTVDYSTDYGATWVRLIGETGVIPDARRTREDFSAEWSRSWPPGLMQVTVAGPTPWDSAAGQLVLT